MSASFLEVRKLRKSFGATDVLKGLTVELGEGEILALLGLSGSGKTTALRLLAGFEEPDSGTVLLNGEDVTRLGPAKRGFGMVFQHYALFPHLTVAQNVAFGLEARGSLRKVEIEQRVEEMLALVDLPGYGARRVSAISGGQQQRVALARALAPEPRLLLLDEPLSNLDPALRERTRSELRTAVKRIGITTVLVTHEQEEAFHVGDRVAVLNSGRLEQAGAPVDLYRRPETPFVAGFIGRSSRLPGRVETSSAAGERVQVLLAGSAESRETELPVTRWLGRAASALSEGETVDLIIRPESLELQANDTAGSLLGTAEDLRYTGALSYGVIAVPGFRKVEVLVGADFVADGREVRIAPGGQGPEPRVFPRDPA
ncbi:MAG: ABC transporter ATP-binding protein [Acidobacteriota bacterium]